MTARELALKLLQLSNADIRVCIEVPCNSGDTIYSADEEIQRVVDLETYVVLSHHKF